MCSLQPLCADDAHDAYQRGLEILMRHAARLDPERAAGWLYLALTDPAELQDVAVRKEYRRRGVGFALSEAAEREAAARGVDRLRVMVSVDNEAAQALYRKCGYLATSIPPVRVLGTVVIRTGPIQVDDTLLVWEKRLVPRTSGY